MKFFLRNNDSEDDVGKMECEQIKLEKATSPEPSYTSDKSKDRHIQFKGGTQRKRRNKRLRPDEATSPAPSCTSLQSDLSMDRPIVFKDEAENIPIIKSLIPGQATSPAPSCTSLQSDLSMDRPILFKDEAQNIWIIKRWPEKRISTASSSASLQSDQSMDRPIQFKTPSFIKVDSVVKENATELSSLRKEMLSPDISTFSATLLTEDHYRCSVCTEVFKNPVSIPCGHSYCKHCIEIYWSKPTQAECYACPLCRKRFRDRPVLNVNVALAKLIEELQRAGFSPALPDHCYAGPEDVSCDICIDMKLKAVKSCLTCCVSYCETHVRQHYTVPALQRHNLIEPCNISCDTETTEKFSAVTKLQEENKVLTATVKKLTSTLTEKAKRFCKTFEVHFNDFPSDIIEVAALGRPLCLGMLYDTKSDSYSQNSFLWNDRIIASMRVSLPRPQTHVKVLEGDFLQDRFRALELSPVLRTRALQGLLEVNGAAAFLNHPVQSEHHDRVTLHYKTTTRLDMISQTLLQEGVSPSVINTTTATHVIIAVCYGAQAFFVFNSSEKKAEMKDVIKKVSSSFCRSHMDSCLNDSVKAMSMFYNCSLYSDMCDWKSPVSFDKAMEIYGSLPGLLGPKGEKAVPLKVWLYPLKKLKTTSACATLNGVSKNLMLRAENIQEHLNKQIRISQDFMTNPDNLSVIIWFPSLKDKLVEFSDLLQKYQADFQEKITEIAEDTQVKEEEEEMRLQHLLERHDQSPFCAENIYQWLENIETKLKILNDCKAADITVVKSQTELQRELNHPQKTRVMCFTLTSPDAEDSFLTVLKQNNESDHIIPADSLQFKPVKISQKVLIDLQLYIAAKEADEDTEQTKFIAASVPDDVFPEYSVQYYYAGRIVSRNMKFEVKPDLAQIAQIKHNSVSLKFNHFFNKSIAGYVVEYRVVEDDGMNNNTWKQKTINTHTLKEKCVLSCLEPDTEYQLRYAVYDNKSMSDFSWITYFKTSSVARPGQPSVVKLNRNTLRLSWLKADANENCPVLQYMVEYKEAGLEGWSSVLTQGPQCDYTLTVAHSTCYRVRVSAVYEDITSKPSEETSVPVDVWTINLSERKSSILLEVLKLQTEKKPVELIDWTHEESEVRGFIQCLPYISQLRFSKDTLKKEEKKKSLIQFLMNLSVEASECDTNTEKNYTELLTSVCNYTSFPYDDDYYYQIDQCDFLLDLYTHVKDYESQTGRSVLLSIQPIYQSSPAVWIIYLSERKSSILLEVLKLQTEKKPVELIGWTHEESEVRGFIQCLPYISQLRFGAFFIKDDPEKCIQFLVDLFVHASEFETDTGEKYTELLTSVCSYTTFPYDDDYYQIDQCDFLLDLYSHVKDYESETGRSVLPSLQSIYQSSPAVWTINLSERKSSILLEVLKLQTEKKPVKLIDWTHEESEVRGFIQCLPYISELRFSKDTLKKEEKKKSLIQFLMNLSVEASECDTNTEKNYTELLTSVCNYTSFPYDDDYYYQIDQCDFLLDLYTHVKDYESQTGRSVLLSIQPIYQSSPAVWIIYLSERKSSILLEVLKLQTEKKPVKLIGWTHEESEVRGFIQCLPYISQLRFGAFFIKDNPEKCIQFLVDLFVHASEFETDTGEKYTELLTSVCSYTTFPYDDDYYQIDQCDFLLDLCSHVKDYESQTGRSVLPSLQSIYQSSPAVWTINLSERKSSILLEVLKLQTEKKPVELIDWTHEESEVRGFIQCLPYISELRFSKDTLKKEEKKKSLIQFLMNLSVEASECDTNTEKNYTELLTSVCNYTSFPYDDDYYYQIDQCDFLLDLYTHVKDYESQTGRSVLLSIQPIYQSSPAVWIIYLSERKSSILLEVLKLQTEKKPVELIGWTHEESEVRGFIQCLPYISQLRFGAFFIKDVPEKCIQFLVDLFVYASEFETDTGEKYTELLTSVCSYTTFPYDDDYYQIDQCDFLLDLYSHVKDYESETGRSVLPSLQSIYQSSPAVWTINLSERKSSILLEVLKLQTEKKPVELIDWTHEESEVRGFIQCLPYISELRFSKDTLKKEEKKKSLIQFLMNLSVAASECDTNTEKNYTELLTSVMMMMMMMMICAGSVITHVKDYESQTGRSVLPSLQSIYQSSPAVWIIYLSERKSSILLEVLKLQTEKKPVKLIGWSGEVRGFIQCLPYISQLRFSNFFIKDDPEEYIQFLVDLFVHASEFETDTGENYTELLTSVCSYTSFPYDDDYYYQIDQCDFLLDLCSHVKDYESQTGRSVLPSLQSIYQSSPAVWTINLSERKSSILLEVLKLQTEKKPVKLIDWTHEESEVRGFIQCLPYISELRFSKETLEKEEKKKSLIQFLMNLSVAASECDTNTEKNYTELLTSVCNYTTFPYDDDDDYYQIDQCDFLLDLCSHVKDYESQTGRSVLPSLQSIYQSTPAVWIINLSERKSSILLEVLKLQTEKKPVELIDWTHEESEVRGFIQCLPYISELRNAERYVPLLCKAFGPKVKRDQVTPLLQALGFTVTLRGKLPSSTCTCVGRVLALSPSKINLTLTPQAISLKGVRFIFRHITHLQKLSLEDRMLKKMVRALRSSFGPSPLTTEELELVTKGSKQNHCRIVRRLTSLLKHLSVQYLDLTNCRIDTVFVTALLCLQGLQTIRFSKETLQQLVSVVYEAQDDGLTRCFLEKVSEDLTACTLTWEVIQYLLQHQALDLNVDLRKSQISCTNTRELVPWLSRIKLKRVSSSFILSIIIEIYESRSPQYVSGLLSSAENYINLKSQVLNSDQCAALRFTLQHCNTVRLDLFWTSIPEEELKSILPLLNRVTQLSVDRQLLLKMLHCCSSSDDQQGAAALLLSALHNKLDFSFCSSLDLTDTQENQNHLNLTKKDCRIISSVLQTSQGVVKLVLEDCKISDRALKQLLPILSRVQLRCSKALLLQFLACISKGTRSGSVRRAQALSQALGEELDLSHTHMNQRACEELVLFLKYSDGLTELDLSHCKLTDQYIEPLLPHLHKTQTLDLSHNNITDELAKRIHSVVSTHSNIQTVRLFGNKIRDVKKYKNDTQIEIW